MPKITLSDTQARVIHYSVSGSDGGRIAYNFGKSNRATFRKLHSLGLIDCPSAGAVLTADGVSVWAALSNDFMQRVFHVAESVSEPEEIPGTPQDTEIHFMGSGALSYSWWDMLQPTYNSAVVDAPDDWGYYGLPGTSDDIDQNSTYKTINHESILNAIRDISKLDKFAEAPARKYVSGWVISECNVWLSQGPDYCDFDAGMADEVMQYAVYGTVIYG